MTNYARPWHRSATALITDLVHYPPGTPGIGDRLRENTEHP